jgi:hypothetical protein
MVVDTRIIGIQEQPVITPLFLYLAYIYIYIYIVEALSYTHTHKKKCGSLYNFLEVKFKLMDKRIKKKSFDKKHTAKKKCLEVN